MTLMKLARFEAASHPLTSTCDGPLDLRQALVAGRLAASRRPRNGIACLSKTKTML